jgi:hypothetical protein
MRLTPTMRRNGVSTLCAVALASCVCFAPVPSTEALLDRDSLKPTEFAANAWRHAAERGVTTIGRIRLPMLAQLLNQLERERPARVELLKLLGPDEYGSAFGDHSLAYQIGSPAECWADLYWLVIRFDSDGRYAGTVTSCD